MSKKAIIYARVSSKEQQQEGYSIPAQLKFLRDYADKNGLSVVQEFSEAETAKKAGRAEFKNMLTFLKNNPDIKIVLVEKTDRLYRNFKDYVILDDFDLVIHLVKENEILSKDSRSHQKFIHGIKVLMAKNYSDNLSEEVKKGHQEKVEQGGYPRPAPLGYKNNKENHTLEIEENSARFVRAAFELYATGNYSLWTLREKLIEEGLVTFYKSGKIPTCSIARLLQSPIYYGYIPYKGRLYKGIHEPLVSKDLFDDVQEILSGKGRSRGKTRRFFTFKKLMVCGNPDCGCAVTAEEHREKVYYHCTNFKNTCTRKSMREDIVAPNFENVLKSLKMDDKFIELVGQGLKESLDDERKHHEQIIASLRKELSVLEDRIQKAYLDKIDGKITEGFWLSQTAEWEKRKTDLIQTFEHHEKANINYLDCGDRLLELANKAFELYSQRKNHEKQELLKFLVSTAKLFLGNLTIELRKPFCWIPVYAKIGDNRGRRDSNSRPHA